MKKKQIIFATETTCWDSVKLKEKNCTWNASHFQVSGLTKNKNAAETRLRLVFSSDFHGEENNTNSIHCRFQEKFFNDTAAEELLQHRSIFRWVCERLRELAPSRGKDKSRPLMEMCVRSFSTRGLTTSYQLFDTALSAAWFIYWFMNCLVVLLIDWFIGLYWAITSDL